MKSLSAIHQPRLVQQTTKLRTFSPWLYLFVVFLLSWPFQFWFAFQASTPFQKYLFSSLSMVMVTVGTLLAAKFVFRDGFKGAGWRWGKPLHYVLVLLLALFIWLVPGLIETFTGLYHPVANVAISSVLLQFLWKFAATLIPAFGEEFGWRGYLLPRLAGIHGAKKGLLLHAFIWWVWHLPVIIAIGLQTSIAGSNGFINVLVMMAITVIPTMLHAVIFAYIWAKTKSLAVATVYHALFDEVRDTLEATTGFGPLVQIWQMVTIILAGALLLWKAKWKELLQHP